MSWDIHIQDLPRGIKRLEDVPEDFVPKALGKSKDVREVEGRAREGGGGGAGGAV